MNIQCGDERDMLNALYALDPFLDPWFWFDRWCPACGNTLNSDGACELAGVSHA